MADSTNTDPRPYIWPFVANAESTYTDPNAPYTGPFVSNDPNVTRTGPHIVFIGRSNTAPGEQVQRQWLYESLLWVEQVHLQEYGSLDRRSVDYIPFMHDANRPLPSRTVVMTKLSAAFQRARDAGCGVILVISGWDGLTLNDMTIGHLAITSRGIDVTLRFYVEDSDDGSRHFRDVNLHDAYAVLGEDMEATDENLKAFIENYRGLQPYRLIHSDSE